jgi:tRNA (guanine10-N2)-dimethyltransferase
MYVLRLSGNPLSLSEAKTVIEDRNGKVKKLLDNLLFFEIKNPDALENLAFSHEVLEFLSETLLKTLDARKWNIEMPYAAHVKGCNAKEIQNRIWQTLENPKVDLEKPKTVIKVFCIGKKLIATKLLFKIDKKQFRERSPSKRPFTRPVVLEPRLARLVVNLSGVKSGETLLDPMVGTGGIILEAVSLGIKAFGSDMDERMVEGARKNLKYFGFSAVLRCGDSRKLKKIWRKKFHAVVTDLPYGVSSKLYGKDFEQLYEETLKSMKDVLRKNGRIVLVFPDKYENVIRKTAKNISLKKKLLVRQRVHKSLTRVLAVFDKAR